LLDVDLTLFIGGIHRVNEKLKIFMMEEKKYP